MKNVTNYVQMQSSVNNSLSCNCLPGCFEITYDSEVSVAPLLPNEALLKNRGITAQNVSIMHIFYENSFFRSQSKDEILGFTEFLCTFSFAFDARFSFLIMYFFGISANTGGLLGLFMGFSVFSIVEIFYFLTFRPCIHHMRKPKERHQPMKRVSKKYQTNHGRISKSLLRSRKRLQLPKNSSVFPYVD